MTYRAVGCAYMRVACAHCSARAGRLFVRRATITALVCGLSQAPRSVMLPEGVGGAKGFRQRGIAYYHRDTCPQARGVLAPPDQRGLPVPEIEVIEPSLVAARNDGLTVATGTRCSGRVNPGAREVAGECGDMGCIVVRASADGAW
jgi:hypothetical protein